MGLNVNQVKHAQRQRSRLPPKKKWYQKHLIWKVLAVGIVVIATITAAAIYGQHPQWQTAKDMAKVSHQAKPKKVTPAKQVQTQVAKKNVQPDYSGQGGLASKAEMLKLAKSKQPEILRGYVAVPSYQISEPVYEGTSNHVLAIGVGINEPNTIFGEGTTRLYGHNMGDYNAKWPYHPTKFSALQNMDEKGILGKSIYLSDGQTVYEYHATKLDYGIPVKSYEQSLQVANTGGAKVQLIACLEDEAFWRQVKASHYTNFHANKRIVLTGQLIKHQPLRSVDATLQTQLQ